MTAPPETLATLLSVLRKRADLSRRQLEMVSGVSEETIKAIEYGRNVRPTPDTLRKLATGIATNRGLDRVDQEAASEMLETLMRAAHYMPAAVPVEPESDDANGALAERLYAAGVSRDRAPLVEKLVLDLARRTPRQQDQLIEMWASMLELAAP